MDSLLIVALASLGVLLHFYFQERHKRRIAYIVHINERTEEAESLDFAVTLFDDEPVSSWELKLNKAFDLCEKRRSYNNARMLAEYKKIEDEAALAKKKK